MLVRPTSNIAVAMTLRSAMLPPPPQRCSEEREQKYNKLRSMIEGKRKESLASSRKTKVAFEHTVAKPPRNIARKQVSAHWGWLL